MSSPSDSPHHDVPGTELCGRQLGDFRILRRLGRGAMAEVFLAEQLSLKRQVAVKVLKAELAGDTTYLKRFQREAQAAASLVHANIVQIYEVGQQDGIHYIAQEYVEGQNLRQWLAQNTPPSLPQILGIMRQVAAALDKAAAHGVVHRDIKPENIMLTAAGEVKVADFGLARLAREHDTAELTQVGMTMGTPLYMSPEQIEGRPLDPRSDIYSFGVTCYQMLAGTPPFDGETALSVALQHLQKAPPPLERLRPDLPAELCQLVHDMLAKDPDQRCPSAREVLRRLRRLHQQLADESWPEQLAQWDTALLAVTDPSLTATTQQLEQLMKATRRRKPAVAKWALLLGVAAAFALGAALAGLVAIDDPLAGGAPPPAAPIPRQPTALRQWYYASRIGTEEAWQSVIDYFPDKRYLVEKAEQQLGRIYLREGRYAKALEIFERFAASGDEQQRAFGLAGQCGVLTLQGKYKQSAEVLERLWPIRQQLQDPQMQQMVEAVIRKNRAKLGTQTAAQWDQWLAEQFGEQEPP